MSTDHEAIKELIAPYVLGAVDPEEEALVRSHLRGCDECSREAETLVPATMSLAEAVDPVTLPEGFADRTLTRLQKEDSRVEPTPAPARRWRLAWALGGAAVLLAALVVALISFQGDTGLDTDEVAALLERPGVALTGDGIEAKVVQTDEGTKFVARGLEPPPEGKVYALWEMSESCAPNANGPCVARPAGTFSEVEDGLVITDFDAELDDLQAAGVTIEDEAVKKPTREPILTSF